MTEYILTNGSTDNRRQDLPAVRDLGGDQPGINDPNVSPTEAPSDGPTPADEGLIGKYPYSGCDIKLVVHMAGEDERASAEEIREAEEEVSRTNQALENALPEQAVSILESELIDTREELESLHSRLAALSAGEGVVDVLSEEELEDNIDLLNSRVASIQSDLARARRDGNREDLQEASRVATRQLEELRRTAPGGNLARTKVLAEIQTLSISDHREKYPVRTLGSVYPRSITRGPRTISGSVVFATFNKHIMHEFLEASEYRSTGVGDFDRFRYSAYLMDQLPPLDISISFANEYGNLSWMAILGVEFVNEGQVMSIEDLYLEGTAQYIARDFDPIRSAANRGFRRNHGVGQTLRGSDIMMEDLRRRGAYRNIPWV